MYTKQIFTETWFTGLLGFPGLPSAWTIARIVDISFDVMKHFIWEKLNNCTNIRINWEHYSMVEICIDERKGLNVLLQPNKQILRKSKIYMISFYLVCQNYKPHSRFFYFRSRQLGKIDFCMQTNKKKTTLDIQRCKVSNNMTKADNQSTKPIGCDTIVNSHSFLLNWCGIFAWLTRNQRRS